MRAKVTGFQLFYASGLLFGILWLIFSHTVTFATTSDQSLATHRQDHLRSIAEYDRLAFVAGAFCLIGLLRERFRKGEPGAAVN